MINRIRTTYGYVTDPQHGVLRRLTLTETPDKPNVLQMHSYVYGFDFDFDDDDYEDDE